MAQSDSRDKKLDSLVAEAVAARAEYFQRKAALDHLRPFLREAIQRSDAADNALQAYLSARAGGSHERYLDEEA